MIDYTQILAINYPNSEWSVDGNSYDGIVWISDTPKPTQVELDALWETTQSIIANKKVANQRQKSYMAESDPLFFKAQRSEGTMAEWEAKVSEIKARYPKV